MTALQVEQRLHAAMYYMQDKLPGAACVHALLALQWFDYNSAAADGHHAPPTQYPPVRHRSYSADSCSSSGQLLL